MTRLMEFKWGTSRGRDSYGYNICSLYVDGRKVSSTCGGGYDMKGSVLGHWVAREFSKELLKLDVPMSRRNGEEVQEYYGLSYHDPNFDPGKAIPEQPPVFGSEADTGKTVAQLEAEGTSLGLERYQQFYRASSRVPTERHIIPLIDGACGMSSVQNIMTALGLSMRFISSHSKIDTYQLEVKP